MYTTYYIFSITLLSLATTDRQDLTHNEEQPGHMKVHHNEEQPGHMKVHHNEEQPGYMKVHHIEADAVSPKPAEEHQDTADNASYQPMTWTGL